MVKLITRLKNSFKEAKANIESKKLDKELIQAAEKDRIDSLVKKKKEELWDEKTKVYNNVREYKIKKGELLEIPGAVINTGGTKPGIIDKIIGMFTGADKIDYRYIGIYFGNGRQLKLVNLPEIKNSLLMRNQENEAHSVVDYDDETWSLNGKSVIWLTPKSVINPNFNEKLEDFVYGLTPVYFWMLLTNVVRTRLTVPIQDKNDLFSGLFTPKKIIIALILIGIVYYMTSQGGQTP